MFVKAHRSTIEKKQTNLFPHSDRVVKNYSSELCYRPLEDRMRRLTYPSSTEFFQVVVLSLDEL